MDSLAQKHIDRFWGKVNKENSTTFYNGSRCWEWGGGLTSAGYGTISIHDKTYVAHRVSYKITKGDPSGLLVCHHCDNRKCVNPSHLFLGTAQDNIDDMVKKGRAKFAIGEDLPQHKLTPSQVEEIRKLYIPNVRGYSLGDLANKYGVHKTAIWYIVHRKTWKDV